MRTILPATADTTGSYSPNDPHLVINPNPNVTPAHKLLVFLPGTGAIPTYYADIVEEAAARGYHGIGLDYPNADTLNSQCQGQTPDCWAPIHYNTLHGTGPGTVDVTNSIDNRLAKLLIYLQATYPAEGWGQYLSGTTPVWSSVVISGHSQGGAHAAYIAKEAYLLARACLFSAPYDTNAYGDADWILDSTHATPATSMFAFINTMDNVETPTNDYRMWQEMGMGNNEVSVDNVSPPYAGSQTLTTSHAPQVAGTDAPHGEPVADRYTPIGPGGVPVHKPVWDNNCFP
jgi:hypothetical protein